MGMRSINITAFNGNLTRDPDIRVLDSGLSVGKLSVAVNDSQKQGDTYEEIASFLDVKVVGKTAEVCGQYLTKGSTVMVEGKLRQERWEKDGKKCSKVVIMANQVIFGARASGAPAASPAGSPATAESVDDEASSLAF